MASRDFFYALQTHPTVTGHFAKRRLTAIPRPAVFCRETRLQDRQGGEQFRWETRQRQPAGPSFVDQYSGRDQMENTCAAFPAGEAPERPRSALRSSRPQLS
jgi:hypothetical protein